MVKVKDAKPFNGVITGRSDLRPEHGGKPYILEATLDDGTKAYILDHEVYLNLGFPGNFLPYNPGAMSEAFVSRKCHGEYWEHDGKKIIVSFKFYGE